MAGAKNPTNPGDFVQQMTNDGRPKRPGYETDYLVNPNDPRIQGFDYSPQKAALLQEISRQGGDAQAQYLAQATQAMGGTGSTSSNMGNRFADIASRTAAEKNKVLADLALKEWQDRQGLMGGYNQAMEARNKLKGAEYGDEVGAYNSEQQAKAANTAAALQLFATIYGGGIGGAAASKMKPRANTLSV